MSKSGPLTDLKSAIGKLATGKLKAPADPATPAGGSDGASIAGNLPRLKAASDTNTVATKGTGRLRDLASGGKPLIRTNGNVADARKKAESVWFLPVRDGAAPDGSGRTIERDARHVNKSDAEANLLAEEQIKTNKALEEAALGKLTKAEQTQYAAVAEAVKGDSCARLALQILLVEGTLPGSKVSLDKKNLLSELAALESQKIVKGMSASELLADMIHEIAVPSAIAQDSKGTCTVTSVQIIVADKDPAEYVRIVRGLASPKGEVKLRNGDKVVREPGTETSDGTKRSSSSRLWQPAMMEYANGTGDYDNKTDKHASGVSGLNSKQVDRILGGLTGGKGVYTEGIQDKGAGKHVDVMANALKEGKQVLAGIDWGIADKDGKADGKHKLNITKITDDRVYYRNPWGTEESMSRKDFEKRLNNYNIVKL